jgi:hypothetical protein
MTCHGCQRALVAVMAAAAVGAGVRARQHWVARGSEDKIVVNLNRAFPSRGSSFKLGLRVRVIQVEVERTSSLLMLVTEMTMPLRHSHRDS